MSVEEWKNRKIICTYNDKVLEMPFLLMIYEGPFSSC